MRIKVFDWLPLMDRLNAKIENRGDTRTISFSNADLVQDAGTLLIFSGVTRQLSRQGYKKLGATQPIRFHGNFPNRRMEYLEGKKRQFF